MNLTYSYIDSLDNKLDIDESDQIKLSKYGSIKDRIYLASNPNTIEDVQLLLATDIEEVALALAGNQYISDNVQTILSNCKYISVKSLLAKNISINQSIQDKLLECSCHAVISSLASNVAITDKTRKVLSKNELADIALSKNPVLF